MVGGYILRKIDSKGKARGRIKPAPINQLGRPLMSLGLVFALFACTTVNAVTGRSQFITIPAAQDQALGLQAITEAKKSLPLIKEGPLLQKVERIGRRIAAISDAPDLAWEFIVIDEPVLNAWALPGGKLAIYRKMLESFPEEAEIAAVIGHEIAHAVLRHGAEQLSRTQVQNVALLGVGVAVGAATGSDTAGLAVMLGGLAAQGFIALPHSRAMELEADHVGTLYMARAGYDPRAAARLWQGMKAMKGEGGATPVFLSTHPDDDRRIERINSQMMLYLAEYERAEKAPLP